MTYNNILYTTVSLFILLASCSSETNSDGICFSFDQKQCQSDPWSQSDMSTPLRERVQSYLLSEDIDLQTIDIEEDFHSVTCLACDVCPDGPRIFVQISLNDKSKIESLNLLDLTDVDCS